jgi:hypothetical protein
MSKFSYFPTDMPPNPDYGTGVFRRRIRLQGEANKVLAELEDGSHAFRSTVYHDGHKVTAIEPEILRYPLTTCPGAAQPIQALVGTALTDSTLNISKAVNPRSNCTHLYDLSVLAIHHCLKGNTIKQYDIAVPDQLDAPIDVTIELNGKRLLSWAVKDWTITENGPLKGLSLHRGFSKWASQHYQGDQQEAAFALQKGYFVSFGRRYDVSNLNGPSVVANGEMLGVCHSYSPGVVEQAVRSEHAVRDFTESQEQLLTFK